MAAFSFDHYSEAQKKAEVTVRTAHAMAAMTGLQNSTQHITTEDEAAAILKGQFKENFAFFESESKKMQQFSGNRNIQDQNTQIAQSQNSTGMPLATDLADNLTAISTRYFSDPQALQEIRFKHNNLDYRITINAQGRISIESTFTQSSGQTASNQLIFGNDGNFYINTFQAQPDGRFGPATACTVNDANITAVLGGDVAQFLQSANVAASKLQTIKAKQLEIYNRVFLPFKTGSKTNIKEILTHVGEGFDWWIFPSSSLENRARSINVDEDAGIYATLAADPAYCARYIDCINAYIDAHAESVDGAIPTPYAVRFQKLRESLVNLTTNGTRLLAAPPPFDANSQRLLFAKVYDFEHLHKLQKYDVPASATDKEKWACRFSTALERVMQGYNMALPRTAGAPVRTAAAAPASALPRAAPVAAAAVASPAAAVGTGAVPAGTGFVPPPPRASAAASLITETNIAVAQKDRGLMAFINNPNVVAVDPAGSAFTGAVATTLSGALGLSEAIYAAIGANSRPQATAPIITGKSTARRTNGSHVTNLYVADACFNSRTNGDIIHAVGPVISIMPGVDPVLAIQKFQDDLKLTMRNIVRSWQANAPQKHLALPLISGGIFFTGSDEDKKKYYYPCLLEAVNEAARAEALTPDAIRRIQIVPYGDKEAQALQEAMAQRLGQPFVALAPAAGTAPAAPTTIIVDKSRFQVPADIIQYVKNINALTDRKARKNALKTKVQDGVFKWDLLTYAIGSNLNILDGQALVDVMNAMIQNGADFNARNEDGTTFLHHLVMWYKNAAAQSQDPSDPQNQLQAQQNFPKIDAVIKALVLQHKPSFFQDKNNLSPLDLLSPGPAETLLYKFLKEKIYVRNFSISPTRVDGAASTTSDYEKKLGIADPRNKGFLSDHTVTKFSTQLAGQEVKVMSWNMMNICRSVADSGGKYSNNPADFHETNKQYVTRLNRQVDYIEDMLLHDKPDFFNLQEAQGLFEITAKGHKKLDPIFQARMREKGYEVVAPDEGKNLITIYKIGYRFNGGNDIHQTLYNPSGYSTTSVITFTNDSGQAIAVGNMHLDYEARSFPELMQVQQHFAQNNVPCILTGDTNHTLEDMQQMVPHAIGDVGHATCFECYEDAVTRAKDYTRFTTTHHNSTQAKSYDLAIGNGVAEIKVENYNEFAIAGGQLVHQPRTVPPLVTASASKAKAAAATIVSPFATPSRTVTAGEFLQPPAPPIFPSPGGFPPPPPGLRESSATITSPFATPSRTVAAGVFPPPPPPGTFPPPPLFGGSTGTSAAAAAEALRHQQEAARLRQQQAEQRAQDAAAREEQARRQEAAARERAERIARKKAERAAQQAAALVKQEADNVKAQAGAPEVIIPKIAQILDQFNENFSPQIDEKDRNTSAKLSFSSANFIKDPRAAELGRFLLENFEQRNSSPQFKAEYDSAQTLFKLLPKPRAAINADSIHFDHEGVHLANEHGALTLASSALDTYGKNTRLNYISFSGLNFVEDENNGARKNKIFGDANIFMASFNNCNFENVDFSEIPLEVLNTIQFANCTFQDCLVPQNFRFKESSLSVAGKITIPVQEELIEKSAEIKANKSMERLRHPKTPRSSVTSPYAVKLNGQNFNIVNSAAHAA